MSSFSYDSGPRGYRSAWPTAAIRGRILTNARIAYYQRKGYYGQTTLGAAFTTAERRPTRRQRSVASALAELLD